MVTGLETAMYAGLWTVGGVGLLAGGYAYAAMWPDSQIFGRTLTAPRKPGELALTFDDGPNPAWTPRLLDLLASYDARATFFLIGSRAKVETRLVRRIVEGGHLIGNHTWSHPNLALTAASRVRDELKRTQEMLEQTAGAPVRFFRPPFGARRPAVLKIAHELGLTPVLWNAMTSDWKEPSAARIAGRISQTIEGLERRGWAANIVLHDGNHLERRGNRGPSVDATGRLLARYKENHRFVKVDAWNS
jgi:peptidoglycan/xylan/chitin deacetylase (PgdA/CDA1 family)